MSKQNYDAKYSYIKYGFTSIEHKAEILPQSVVCLKTLCNAAMKPSLLKRHLERNYPNKINAEKSYFQQLAENVKRQRMNETGQMEQKKADVARLLWVVLGGCSTIEWFLDKMTVSLIASSLSPSFFFC